MGRVPEQSPRIHRASGWVVKVRCTLGCTYDAANRDGITTELMLQPLAGKNRKPYADKYRHAAFFAFTAGALSYAVHVLRGWYACAYRFVNTANGEDTCVARVGKVFVG